MGKLRPRAASDAEDFSTIFFSVSGFSSELRQGQQGKLDLAQAMRPAIALNPRNGYQRREDPVMWPLEQIVAIVFIGMFQLAIGLLIARYLRKVPEPLLERQLAVTIALSRLRESLAAAADRELVTRLEHLARLQDQLASAQVADLDAWTTTLRSLVEQVIELTRGIQENIQAANLRIGDERSLPGAERTLDSAGLAAEQWFPQGKSAPWPVMNENRKAPRFPYPHIHPIAPVIGNELPEPHRFFDVQFRDISTDGFAFDVPESFAFDQLVARLGAAPNSVLVRAKVVHQRELGFGETAIFRVGCQILNRMAEVQTPGDVMHLR